jgi:hypothetical protein
VAILREIREFYYYRWGSLPGGMEAPHARKKGENFILGHFYFILNLDVGRKPKSLPISNGLEVRGRIGGAGGTHAYTCANSQVP